MKSIKGIRTPAGLAPAEFRQYKACCAAIFCVYHKDEIGYSNIRGREFLDQCKPPPYVPHSLDCSAFVTYCYDVGGAPDPSNADYNGGPSTRTLWPNGKLVGTTSYKEASLEPGDLVFYSNSTPQGGNSEHVSIYIEDGLTCSMGGQHGPITISIKDSEQYGPPLFGIRRYPFG